jgi:ribonuclease HI
VREEGPWRRLRKSLQATQRGKSPAGLHEDSGAREGVKAPRTGVVEIFTDGACKGNPGVGGWGVLLRYNGHTRELCGGEKLTTNNRMELLAVIRALEALTKPCEVRLHTDSTYVQKGISEWIHSWKKRDWRTADKKPVKNDDLWKELDRLAQRHKIEWLWVRGHSGHDGNEQADRLANQGVQSVLENSGLTASPATRALSREFDE